MSIKEIKDDLHKKIDNIQDESILQEFRSSLQELVDEDLGKDFWDDLTEIQRKNIEVSLREIEKGETIGHKGVLRNARKWLEK